MFEEYLRRTTFVFLHGGLLLLYFGVIGHSYWRLRRERGALRQLEEDWEELSDADESDPGRSLARLRDTLGALPPTALSRQLRATLGPAGGDFDAQRVLTQLGRSLAAADDVIRFCINGLVIVGLMGTLYAFYEMWGEHGAANLTAANSTLYLESMSTALLVSLVGLVLALITNFFFSFLRAGRQAFLGRVAAFVTPVAGLLPSDSKTHLLLTNLLAPLSRLVEQITLQNDHVLRGLTEAVNTRTEQLNEAIENATAEWQGAIGAFRAETLTAVDSMQRAASHLADSSVAVAGTLREVGRSLERTKDIGRIVSQLETSSGQVVATLANRLDAATAGWVTAYNRAAQDYENAMRQQAETASKVGREVTAIIRDDLNALVTSATDEFDRLREQFSGSLEAAAASLTTTLDAFAGTFAGSLETLAAKWMTEATSVTDVTAAKLEGVVGGWKEVVTATSTKVNSSLADSGELVRVTTQNVSALSADLQSLQGLVRAAAEKEGAPVYLGQAVERLGEIGEALAALAAKLEYGRALNQLQEAVTDSRSDVGRLAKQVGSLEDATRKDGSAVNERFSDLGRRLDRLDTGVSTLCEEVRQLPTRSRTPRRPPAPPPPPPTFWQRLRAKLTRHKPTEGAPGAYESGYYQPDGEEP